MLIAELDDKLYHYEGYSQIRVTVRGLVFNDRGELGLMHIIGEDFFGVRDHYETIGGGVEPHETRVETLRREVREEIGYDCVVGDYLGMIIDHYNLLNRISIHHFYTCKITLKEKAAWTATEMVLFEGVEWKSLHEWDEILNRSVEMVNELVHARERLILKRFLHQQEMLQD